MTKFARLIMVTGENNNKFYEMNWDGVSSNFNVEYGRVERTSQKVSYPIHDLIKKFNEKVKKGYTDVTHTVSKTVDPKKDAQDDDIEIENVKDAKVQEFLNLMQKYTKGLVAKTYTVKTKDVTQV